MPSSSNGTTYLEKSLITHFRKVYVHLRLSEREEELEHLINEMVHALDLPNARLQLALCPSSLPFAQRLKAQRDVEAMERLFRESRALKPCERICLAGTACGDIGWLLKQRGRMAEGEQWCGYDGLLASLACKVLEEEKLLEAACQAAEEEERASRRPWVQARAQRREVVGIE